MFMFIFDIIFNFFWVSSNQFMRFMTIWFRLIILEFLRIDLNIMVLMVIESTQLLLTINSVQIDHYLYLIMSLYQMTLKIIIIPISYSATRTVWLNYIILLLF